MLTLEEAIKKVKEIRQNVDMCVEYENGYMFIAKEDSDYDGGYGHAPIVILKDTGKVVSMPQFILAGAGEEISRKEI